MSRTTASIVCAALYIGTTKDKAGSIGTAWLGVDYVTAAPVDIA